jgi:hypothetical protein
MADVYGIVAGFRLKPGAGKKGLVVLETEMRKEQQPAGEEEKTGGQSVVPSISDVGEPIHEVFAR